MTTYGENDIFNNKMTKKNCKMRANVSFFHTVDTDMRINDNYEQNTFYVKSFLGFKISILNNFMMKIG